MSDLLNRLKKNSNLEYTTTLSDSALFKERSQTPTEVPIINLAFSGTFSKGFGSGITMFAGPSKHFKSNLGLLCVRSYLKQHKDSICIYYDSEFGCTPEYLKAAGIDPERVLHTPIMDVEELKFDIVRQLEEIKKGERVIIFIDSVGNLASKKELEDAKSEKSAADMSRAKQLKSLWRMVTPYLTMKDIPCIVVNHSYETQEMFCLNGETKIRTENGLMKLKDINIGDNVYALDGKLKPVINKFLPSELPNPKKYMRLTFEDGSFVECTDTHKFLMKDGSWKAASDIVEGEDFK